MTKQDIKGLIGLILLILALAVLPPYKPDTAQQLHPITSQPQCPDFPPIDGAGRPTACDGK